MRLLRAVLAGTAVSLAVNTPVGAQSRQDSISERAPRFFVAASPRPVPVDINRTAFLKGRISLALDGATYREALGAIQRQAGFPIVYSDDDLPPGRVVVLKAEEITVAGALTAVLLDAGVDVIFSPDIQAVIVKRPLARPGSLLRMIARRGAGKDSGPPLFGAGATVGA